MPTCDVMMYIYKQNKYLSFCLKNLIKQRKTGCNDNCLVTFKLLMLEISEEEVGLLVNEKAV